MEIQTNWLEDEALWLRKRPWLGKERSIEVKKALSLAHKGKPSWNKGKKMSEEWKLKLSKSHLGNKLTIEHRKKLSIALSGSKSFLWKGGIYNSKYPKIFNNILKQRIKERDNYTCQRCGEKNKRLDIHHIDENKNNNNQENLITFCISCHQKIHTEIKLIQMKGG